MALSKSQKSLKSWTKEDWGTKSGKPSTQGKKATGERYLPMKARDALSDAEYAATSRAKREGKKAGKQFVKQPKKIAEKTAKFRANEGGMTPMKKPMNEGMEALKKAAPAVAKRMGYKKGGAVKMANCGASVPPAKKMYGGGMMKKSKK
jgi:hypothetical protein